MRSLLMLIAGSDNVGRIPPYNLETGNCSVVDDRPSRNHSSISDLCSRHDTDAGAYPDIIPDSHFSTSRRAIRAAPPRQNPPSRAEHNAITDFNRTGRIDYVGFTDGHAIPCHNLLRMMDQHILTDTQSVPSLAKVMSINPSPQLYAKFARTFTKQPLQSRKTPLLAPQIAIEQFEQMHHTPQRRSFVLFIIGSTCCRNLHGRGL